MNFQKSGLAILIVNLLALQGVMERHQQKKYYIVFSQHLTTRLKHQVTTIAP